MSSDNKELDRLVERVAYAMKTMSFSPDNEQRVVELELAERAVRSILKDWFESVDLTMDKMIDDWEARMVGEETFYSLGIRRVKDVLHGDTSIGTP